MKRFKWCPKEIMQKCLMCLPEPHAHICIGSLLADRQEPQCKGPALRLNFHDLDPEAIRRTNAFADDPEKGEELVQGCMNEDQAKQIVQFVKDCPDDLLILVNCEAGVSRSPGVVLALRRHYGGDTEECYDRAHPNIHVASLLGKVLQEDSGGGKSKA